MAKEKPSAPPAKAVVCLRCGPVELDRQSGIVRCGTRAVRLTRKECALLAVLLSAPGRVFTREELLACVWQVHCPLYTRTVDMHIRQLRKKLGDAQRIRTVYRRGYRWEPGLYPWLGGADANGALGGANDCRKNDVLCYNKFVPEREGAALAARAHPRHLPTKSTARRAVAALRAALGHAAARRGPRPCRAV